MRKERKRWKRDCVKLLRLLRDADSFEFVMLAMLQAVKTEAKRNASKQVM